MLAPTVLASADTFDARRTAAYRRGATPEPYRHQRQRSAQCRILPASRTDRLARSRKLRRLGQQEDCCPRSRIDVPAPMHSWSARGSCERHREILRYIGANSTARARVSASIVPQTLAAITHPFCGRWPAIPVVSTIEPSLRIRGLTLYLRMPVCRRSRTSSWRLSAPNALRVFECLTSAWLCNASPAQNSCLP